MHHATASARNSGKPRRRGRRRAASEAPRARCGPSFGRARSSPRRTRSGCSGECLGGMRASLHQRLGWSAGLADLAKVAVLQRRRNCSAWMEHLVGPLLGGGAVPAAAGQAHSPRRWDAGSKGRKGSQDHGGLWRLHALSIFQANASATSSCRLKNGGQRLLGRQSPRSLLIADRGLLGPPSCGRMSCGADIGTMLLEGRALPRAPRQAVRYPSALKGQSAGVLDPPHRDLTQQTARLTLRLVAFRKPPEAAKSASQSAARPRSEGNGTWAARFARSLTEASRDGLQPARSTASRRKAHGVAQDSGRKKVPVMAACRPTVTSRTGSRRCLTPCIYWARAANSPRHEDAGPEVHPARMRRRGSM